MTLGPLICLIALLVGIIKMVELLRGPKRKGRSGNGKHLDVLKNWEPPKAVPEENRYRSRRTILSPTEQTFFKALYEAAVPDHGISLKVRVADILQSEGTGSEYMRNFGRIKAKHIDFLLYDTTTFQITAAIELDDSSHWRKDRRERDDFLNESFEKAGIPLCRFQARLSYDPYEIAEKIGMKLTPKQIKRREEHPDARYMPISSATSPGSLL